MVLGTIRHHCYMRPFTELPGAILFPKALFVIAPSSRPLSIRVIAVAISRFPVDTFLSIIKWRRAIKLDLHINTHFFLTKITSVSYLKHRRLNFTANLNIFIFLASSITGLILLVINTWYLALNKRAGRKIVTFFLPLNRVTYYSCH